MMTRLPALLLLALAAAPLAAQTTAADGSSQFTFPVTGDVPDQCLLGNPTVANGAAATNIRSTAGNVVTIDELADSQTLSTNASDVTVAIAAVCNYPFRVTMTSQNNGLWRQSAESVNPVGFANAVPYLAELAWDDDGVQIDADARTRQPREAAFSSNQASASDLTLRLRVLPRTTNTVAGAPLVAGDYRDTISITVGPQ